MLYLKLMFSNDKKPVIIFLKIILEGRFNIRQASLFNNVLHSHFKK